MNGRNRSSAGFTVLLCVTCWLLQGRLLAQCESPLGEEDISRLALEPPRSAQPGQTIYFYFGVIECCYWFRYVPACVEWSVDPPGAAAIIEEPPPQKDPLDDFARPGRLQVDAETPHGTVITLTANVEAGRRVLSARVNVYTPAANPLVGFWRESAQITCSEFIRGDADQSGDLTITDPIRILNVLFLGEETGECFEAMDASDEGSIDISDAVYLLNYLFTGGQAPRAPFPECGPWMQSGRADHGCSFFAPCPISEVEPGQPIEELAFDADGTFSVTWTPFEVYKDYWGTYGYDLSTGAIRLQVEGGNYTPPDVRAGFGHFAVDGSTLRLDDLWLGTPRDVPGEARCGHVFGK